MDEKVQHGLALACVRLAQQTIEDNEVTVREQATPVSQRMLEDLKAWEAKPAKDAPKLLVVSTGTVQANKAMGLYSPIVLDQNMSIGSKFGAHGTPMAVLVDAEGKIASEVAAGAQAALALARGGQNQVPAT